LALHVADGRLDLSELPSLPDEDVIQRITAVKGPGERAAPMFLTFRPGRPAAPPIGGPGGPNGTPVPSGPATTPTPHEACAIGAKWAPFRSLGSWYMWRAVEQPTAPDI